MCFVIWNFKVYLPWSEHTQFWKSGYLAPTILFKFCYHFCANTGAKEVASYFSNCNFKILTRTLTRNYAVLYIEFFLSLYRLWIAKRRLLCFQRHHSPLFVLGMPNWGFLERFHLQGTCLGLGSMVSHLIQIQCFLRRPLSKFQNPIQNLRNLKSQDLFYSKSLRTFFHSRI